MGTSVIAEHQAPVFGRSRAKIMKKPIFLALALSCAAPTFAAENSASDTLPLRDVVLFSSGVGYFGRAGKISGNADIALKFRAPQLPDILKSLVIFDSKGTVKPVTYSIEDYLRQRPRERDLNLNPNATLGNLLSSFQGAQVRLETEAGVKEGRIISVATKVMLVDKVQIPTEIVMLLTNSGLETVPLSAVSSVKLLDAKLDAKLRATLEKTALNMTAELDDGLRPVSLHFAGKGEREVRAGYLLETPAWKNSYRLILEDKKKPFLQGWAILENTTDEDWKNVRLSLISGRPVSFIQDLASPLWISRVVVPPPVIAAPRPQTYGDAIGQTEDNESVVRNGANLFRLGEQQARNAPRVAAPPRMSIAPSVLHATGAANYLANDVSEVAKQGAAQNAPGVAPQASAANVGDLFEYAVKEPVTLDRGQAAMVPILGENVGGEPISIVDAAEADGNTIPVANGFRLVNTSTLSLPGGPITVYQDGVYAGDALVSNLQPNEAKLISYALDLDMNASRQETSQPLILTNLSVENGVLTLSRRATKTTIYNLRNKSSKTKAVFIQQPIEADWKLVDAKQVHHKTAESYRFRVEVKPNSSLEFKVESEKPLFETVEIYGASLEALRGWADVKVISPEAKKALEDLIERRKKLQNVTTQRVAQEKNLSAIEADQQRIRSNMNVLDHDSALYKQYEAKLTEQEPKIEKIRAELERLRAEEAELTVQLQGYVKNLTF